MILRRLLLISTFLWVCRADPTFAVTNSMLDPNRLTWWRTKWAAAPIQLSVNNQNQASSVSFFISPSTSLLNGVFEVTFPTGFTIAAGKSQTYSGQVVQVLGQTYTGGQDYTVTITGITNPASSGAYGPFALRTRYFPAGQQVDVNLTFGSVYITGAAGTLGSLSVAFTGPTSTNVINKGGNSLSFKFTIGVSLWKYDTFIITTDSRWTIGTTPMCSSVDSAGHWNNFNGTNSGNPHQLDCTVTTQSVAAPVSQTIYIYGLAVDGVDLTATTDNQYVGLAISPVTTPNAVYVGNSYTWQVQTCRFGTTTILESGTLGTGPVLINDAITSASWTPTWGVSPTTLTLGSSYFMDLSFTTTNHLPVGGSIVIVLSEDLTQGVDTNWVSSMTGATNCYIVTYLSNTVSCTVASGGVTLASLPDLPGGSAIKIRNIVKISKGAGSTEQIVSIQTYQTTVAANIQVDYGSQLGAFTLAANTAVLTTFGLLFHATSDGATGTNPPVSVSAAGGSGASTQAFQFTIIPPATAFATFTTSTDVLINCPLGNSVSDLNIGVPSYTFQYFDSATPNAVMTGLTLVTANSPTLSTASSATTLGSIDFKGNINSSTVSFTLGAHLMVATGTASTYITLPRVVNNLATAYECSVAVSTSGATTYLAAVRFGVSVQSWKTSPSFIIPCTYNVNGMIGIFTFLPGTTALLASTTTATYYVEVEIPVGTTAGTSTAGMGSGLTLTPVPSPNGEGVMSSAVPYPHDKSVSATTSGVLYVIVNNYVAITGLGTIPTTGTAVSLYIPLGGIVAGAITATLRSYYILSADPRYKFITHSGSVTSAVLITTAPAGSWTSSPTPVTGGSTINGATNPALVLNLYDTGVAAGYYMQFIFPTGYTWATSGKSVQNIIGAGSTYTAWWFSSTNPSFAFPSVLVTSGAVALPSTTASAGSVSIAGFTIPLGSGLTTSMIAIQASNTVGGAACATYGTFTLTSTPGAISNVNVTPSSIKTRGPDGVSVQHTVGFTLQHGIPLGGSITMKIASVWGVSSTSCTYCTLSAGLTPPVGGTISCSMSGVIVTVTGFADFSSATQTAVSIQVFGLFPPTTVSATGGTAFLSGLTTATSAGATIDTLTSYTATAVTVLASSSAGSTTWITKKTFPMNAGATGVDLYLKFSLTHAIPKCGIITLSSPLAFLSNSGLTNSCFLSPIQYSNCAMSATNLQITLGQNYVGGTVLELYLDSAVNNPTTSSPTATGFMITSTWGLSTVILDADSGSIQSSQTFTAWAAMNSTITNTSLSFIPMTTGEVATYTFSFQDSVKYDVGDQYWIVFPPQFDYFLGDVWVWFTNEPNSYYISCSSTMGNTLCTIDHNVVVVQGNNIIAAGSQITVVINQVVNPATGKTDNFQVYHVDNNGNYLTVHQTYGSVNPTAFPANLNVRSLVLTDNRLFKTADYTWRVYITDAMNTDSQLQVLFPREFDLNSSSKKSSYLCSSTWLDDSPGATNKNQQNWNPATSCSASGNYITLPAPLVTTTFTSTSIVTWTIQGLANNQWGQSRSVLNLYTDFDVQDSTLWPIYPYWVSKFTFFVYRSSTTNLMFTSRSYPNTNSAYTGFRDGYRPLYVNGYLPQSKTNRIIVYAGTQTTDLYISTASVSQPMAAKQVILTPTTNSKTPDKGKLLYTSALDNWILFQSFWQCRFRVAAAIDLMKGLYYIDWANNESVQTGMSDVQYDTPVSTLVEVIPQTAGKYVFVISAIPSVATGATSVPIKISISNPPHSGVTISIAISGIPANVSISPSSLTFGPDVNSKYFQIQVASAFDLSLGATQTLLFALTGTDAYTYSISSTVSFTISNSSASATPGNVQNWGLGKPSKTTQTIVPATDQPGIVYYALAAFGSAVPSFTTLKTSVGSILTGNSTATTQDGNTESDPKSGESWDDFQHRLYKTHLEQVWVGSLPIISTTPTNSVNFTWLYAATNYQISGYLDNLGPSTSIPIVRTEYFTTAAIADCQPFLIKFQGLVDQSFNAKIVTEAANVIGVNPLRLANFTYATSQSRRLQTIAATGSTTFSYVLLPNRFSEGPDPSDQAQMSTAAQATLAAALHTDGISNSLSSVTNGPAQKRTTPQWTQTPTGSGSTNSTLTVSFLANTAGKACCVALTSSAQSPSADQVMLGLDAGNNAASQGCIFTDLSKNTNSVQITGLQAGTTYYAFCTATDNYPLWPTEMSYSSTNPMSPVAISTIAAASTTGTSSSRTSYFTGLVLFAVFLLQ